MNAVKTLNGLEVVASVRAMLVEQLADLKRLRASLLDVFAGPIFAVSLPGGFLVQRGGKWLPTSLAKCVRFDCREAYSLAAIVSDGNGTRAKVVVIREAALVEIAKTEELIATLDAVP